jgi:hypothetical protein
VLCVVSVYLQPAGARWPASRLAGRRAVMQLQECDYD